MNLVALHAFTDNYIWMLHDGHQALVVDPGDSVPVLEALDSLGLRLTAILVTHHHGDHVGGLPRLLERLDGPLRGPARESIGVPFEPMRSGDRFDWSGWRFRVIDVPGHTAGHVAYVGEGPATEAPVLFCGDTLFSAGCGRLFEGTPAQMHASLQALAAGPGATRVCCAHEYTLGNLRFALAVEPGNPVLQSHASHCRALRQQGLPTLPSSLALELQINPFLRCSEPAVVASAQQHGAAEDGPVPVLAALREWKNNFS